MSILFSIIIPTFNRVVALERCLNSLLLQSYKNFEVIVCDDGSTDNTQEMVEEFKGRMNIRYHHNENWGGPARPRNLGLNEARGEWICFLDSDDWYHNDRLDYLSKIVGDDFDVYHHHLLSVDGSNIISGRIPTWQINNANATLDLLTNFNGILTSSTCLRKATFDKLKLFFSEDKRIIGLEDFDLWIKLAFSGAKFKLLNKNLGYYSVDGTDHITFLDQRQIDRLFELYSSNQNKLSYKDRKKSIAAFNYQKACILTIGKDFAGAAKCFMFALKYGTRKIKVRSIYKLLFNRL